MKSKLQQGFTLIELMIVVAIIGILAAVALPAYQDYTTRAKVSEVILAADPAKVAVSEYYQANGAMPATSSMVAGTDFTSTASKYVNDVAYALSGTLGKVTVTTTTTGDTNIASKTLTLTGTGGTGGVVTWACSAGATNPITAKYLPASCK